MLRFLSLRAAEGPLSISAKWKGQFGASGRLGSEQVARDRSEATLG